jgi:RNA polymerase sigma-70 factor, ECF subfamily
MSVGTLKHRALPEPDAKRERVSPVFDVQQVYEAHYRYVWRCLRSLGVREAQLDDALQDVFMVVQRRLAEFDGQASLSTWLYAIALRVARKARERSRREADKSGEPLSTEEARAPGADAEATLSSNQRLLLARRALEALDDDKREVFVLANIEQMSAPEIVEVLGIPLNTVYSRLRAARLAFASEVARLADRPRSAP